MDAYNAYQMFCSLDIQLRSRSFDNANRVLTTINNDLYANFCIPTCKDYNNAYAQTTAFYFTLELDDNENPIIQKEGQHFVHRWSYIISSIAPLDFLANIQAVIQKNDNFQKYIYLFMPALGNAISLLSDEEVLHNFPLIQKIFNIVLPKKQSEITKPVWQAIGKFSPEDDITQLLLKNMEISFAPIAPNLIQKNPNKFSTLLFQRASSDYLNEFLKNCPQSYKLGIDEGINRASKDCSKLGTAGFNSTCQLLGNILHYYQFDFTEEQQNNIKSVLNQIFSFLSDENITPNDTNSIVLTLYEGAKKNLFEKAQLKELLPKIKFSDDCPQLHITFVKATILCMDKEGDNSQAYKNLLTIQPWYGQIYSQYLEVIEEYSAFLKEVNRDQFLRILWSVFHPLSLEPNTAVSIVKFLLKMSPVDVLEPRVDARLDLLFDSYFRFGNAELSKLTYQLAKLYKYSPPITKIDLFGKFNEYQIQLLSNVDPSLIKEIIESRLIEPSKRYCLLTVMQSWPRRYHEFAIPLINLLYGFCKVLGITTDIDNVFSRVGLQKVDFSEEIVTFEELNQLYAEMDGPIDQSSFGTLLIATLETLSAICTDPNNRSNVHQNHVAKAAVIGSYLILVCPKHVLSMLNRFHSSRPKNPKSDGNDKKIVEKAETNTAANAYTEAFRVVENAKIPIKYSIDVVSYANTCYGGYKGAVKRFPKHIDEALSKSRIVADMFRNNLKQPLQPLKTFLSFVGPKEHAEWVSVCQQVIPPQEWKIRPSDAKTIDALKDLPEETKRIISDRFKALKNMPKQVPLVKESYDNRPDYMRLKSPIQILAGPRVHPKDKKSVKPGPITITQLPPPTESKTENQPPEEIITEEESDKENSKDTENSNVTENSNATENPAVDENCGTLYEVISFLWHSRANLPESIKPEDLEKLALENPRNVKLLIGFFSWASTHNYKIDLTKWQNKIYVKRHTNSWLFAIALFASNIHCSFLQIPLPIIKVFQRCFTSFGYPSISKASLAHGYRHLTGIRWLIVRNIIAIDPSFFSDYPLIVIELTKNMDTFKKYFDELDTQDYNKVNFDTFIGINDILFNPARKEMIQMLTIPTNRSFNSKLYSFKDISVIPKQIEIPNELLESIITALQKAKNVSYNYFAFFMNIKMTKVQFSRVYDIFFKDRQSSDLARKFMLPSLFVSETGKSAYMEDEAIRFYSRKPPSLTRAFFRSLLCQFAPPVKQDLILKIESKLEDVFPGLCYNGFGKSGIKMWQHHSLPLSRLRFGYIDDKIGPSLLHDLRVPSKEALTIYKLLFALPDKELELITNGKIKGMIRGELARFLLNTATSEGSDASFAIRTINILCETLGVANSMTLIARKESLERPNFFCIMVILQSLSKIAQRYKNQKALDLLKNLKDPESKLFENEERKKLFLNLESDDSISEIIHPTA
ncbi:hypothetical protein M9Y10_029997 [Tritrichomonas musculus]|uniref:Uncharacterized protein n=1 Tax=Tritrichomonas musculus TaxID=1915356 RepID=A0ABR2KPK0_9EUKA